jgi:hypothetical protein
MQQRPRIARIPQIRSEFGVPNGGAIDESALSRVVGGVVDYTERKGRGPDGHSSFLEKVARECLLAPPIMLESTLERSVDEEATGE